MIDDDDLSPADRVYFAGLAERNKELLDHLTPYFEATADFAKEAGATGLATAALLLKESLIVYCQEIVKFADKVTQDRP